VEEFTGAVKDALRRGRGRRQCCPGDRDRSRRSEKGRRGRGAASGAEEHVGEGHPGADPDGVVGGVNAGVEQCGMQSRATGGAWPVGKPGDRAFGGWPQLRLASGGTVSSSSTGDSGDRRRVQLGQRVLQPWRMLMSSFVELDHMSSSMTLTPLSSALMMGT
jgi:hypothetical protein